MLKVLGCGLEISEFELQSFTFGLIFLRKVWTHLFPLYGLNSITAFPLQGWLRHLIYQEGLYSLPPPQKKIKPQNKMVWNTHLLYYMKFTQIKLPYLLHSVDDRAIGIMVRVFANGPGDRDLIPGQVIPKTQKMVLDATLLNTQHYKVHSKGKVEQSREWSSAIPYTLV